MLHRLKAVIKAFKIPYSISKSKEMETLYNPEFVAKIQKSRKQDIENADLPKWEKDLIDKRLDALAKKPKRLKSGNNLLDQLNLKV